MTYAEINMNHNRTSINAHRINVEHNGTISCHYIYGQTREQAISNLLSTGWWQNSSRNLA